MSEPVTLRLLLAVAYIWLIRRGLAWRFISPRTAKALVSPLLPGDPD